MKIKGKKIEGANVEVVVIPRGNGVEDIVFKCQAILDMKDFDALCPMPEAPGIILAGGRRAKDTENLVFKEELEQYGKKRVSWMLINSLRATEGLEWETVVYNNSDTWNNYERELRDSGFTEGEIARIITGVMTANGLNEDRIQEARERFFTSTLLTTLQPSSQMAELNSTPSGGSVNA